ncbi:MAG: hypothetical protein R3220_09830 [Balneolaceae bacterium]|nr:hypothetical protein [Balneolaceae bacterium]
MAELSSKALANFTAASSALILTESLRLVRNYRYYNNLSVDRVARDRLIKKVRNMRRLAFSLQNLMSRGEPDEAPFYVSVAGGINDILEELHRKLLFFDAEDIVDIVPLIDQQRKFWADFTEVDFYDSSIMNELEHSIPKKLIKIEKLLLGLPPFASV